MRLSALVPFVLLALAAATVVWQAPQAVVDATRDIEQGNDLSLRQRSLEPLLAQNVSPEVVAAAAEAIPEDARYTLVVGDGISLTETERAALEPLLRYRLLPRRFTSAAEAEWAIAYGAPAVELADAREAVPGVVIGRMPP
jgi:hypothetical protein